jgi:tetratricopeptide (TPR) repeat protein
MMAHLERLGRRTLWCSGEAMASDLAAPNPLALSFWQKMLAPIRSCRDGLVVRLYEFARRCDERKNSHSSRSAGAASAGELPVENSLRDLSQLPRPAGTQTSKYDHLVLLAWQMVLLLDPSDATAAVLTSDRLVDLGLRHQAKDYLKRRLARHSRDVESRLALARLYLAPFDSEAAEEHLRAACAIAPEDPRLLLFAALLYRYRSQLADSNACLERLFDRVDDCDPRCVYAENLIDQGRTDSAASVLQEVVSLHPACPGAYKILSKLKYYRQKDHPHLRQIEVLLNGGDLPNLKARLFHHMLATAYDAVAEWDEAFRHAAKFNELTEYLCDMDEIERDVDRTLAVFSESFMVEFAKQNESRADVGRGLIFIVGMPRSGSSLLEQILASHPDVAAGGERSDIADLAENLPGLIGRRESYPRCVARISVRDLDRLASQHIERALRAAGPAHFFVDKGVINFMYVGLISLLLPGATIVHCKRDPLDTCLSCYFQNFESINYAHDLVLLGRMYRVYLRWMGHWTAHFGPQILDLQYEELVRSPEEVVGRLLAHCGLPYDERCLHFHKTERVTLTASSVQVKSPIYSSSVGRWRNYRRHLQPLIDILGESQAHSAITY